MNKTKNQILKEIFKNAVMEAMSEIMPHMIEEMKSVHVGGLNPMIPVQEQLKYNFGLNQPQYSTSSLNGKPLNVQPVPTPTNQNAYSNLFNKLSGQINMSDLAPDFE